MTSQIIIRIDSEVKDKFYRLARLEGKRTSQLLRELIEDYIKERDISTYIDSLWERIGGKLKSKGIKPEDIETYIKEERKNFHESGR